MEIVSDALLEVAEKKKTLVQKAKDFAGRVNYFRALGTVADFGVGMALGIPPGLLTRAGGAISSLFSGTGTEADMGTVRKEATEAAKSLAGLVKPAAVKTPPKEIAAFRQEFGELLDGLDTTLVLFVDNLDRCLPDVAIATLEAIRLFLFLPRTAFVIAADEGMIRHSVAKHFGDPQATHVRDYLDKVIQVPLRVPQVGAEDLRAYMYSLFVGLAAPAALSAVQERLLRALQAAWMGETFEREEIAGLAGNPPELLDNLAIADQLAPILARAPEIQGNPRIVKRLLNAIFLRRQLARNRTMNVDLATLAKLAVFERCTDEKATLTLYRLVIEDENAERHLLNDSEQGETARPEPPPEWKTHADFIGRWREMEPSFAGVDLRPAVFLSRDVLAPARSRSETSAAVRQAVAALLKVDSVNSPAGKALVGKLTVAEREEVMSLLVKALRQADWTLAYPGIHGAVILANTSPALLTELKAFAGSLTLEGMSSGVRFVLNKAGLIKS